MKTPLCHTPTLPLNRGSRNILDDMSVQSRRSLIAGRITTGGEVDFASLSQEFGVSEMTIRRDVDALEARGLVRRVPGGAIAMKSMPLPGIGPGDSDVGRERRALAELALQEISSGNTVALTPGPVNQCIAEFIAASTMSLTVVTSDLKVAYLLTGNSNCRIFVSGGQVDHQDHAIVKQSSAGAQLHFHFDLAIVDGVALDAARGASLDDPEKASILRDVARASTRVVAVAESRSIDRFAFARVCLLEDFDAVILPREHATGAFAAAAVDAGVRVLSNEG